MRKKIRKILSICLLACLIAGTGSMDSKAYFQRGPVNVSVGKSSVSIKQGQSETVSVSFSPSKSSQLPGCGMAECPQSCGEKECLDENGECTCNGTTYKTYYAFATVLSSNTSVATAEYGNGSVRIKGISAGTATITVVASLRQFSSTSATIKVTVSKAAEETTKAETKAPVKETTKAETKAPVKETTKAETKTPVKETTKAQTTGTSETTSGGVSAIQVTGETAPKDDKNNESPAESSGEETSIESAETGEGTSMAAEENTGDDSGITTIQSDRGSITFVPIVAGKIGKEQLESILGQKAYVDFQKKDEAGTVLYAWEFCGTDLKKAEDVDLSVEISNTPFANCGYGTSSDSLYLSFGQNGELPGTGSLFIRVLDQFSDDQKLNLYSYEDNQIKLLAENLTVENGYVTLSLDRCSDSILSAERWENNGTGSSGKIPMFLVIGAAGMACGAAAVLMRRRKGIRK